MVGSAQIAPPVFASRGVVSAPVQQAPAAEAGALSWAATLTMYNNMVAASKVATSSTNFIEWRYPEDGCWARAYISLRIMRGLQPAATLGRIWALGQKEQAYKNYYEGRGPLPGNQPWTLVSASTLYGYKTWDFHTAPTARVVQANGSVTTMVLDYGLFDLPVSISQWQARMSGVYGWYTTGYGQANPVTHTGTGYWLNNDPAGSLNTASHNTMISDHNAAVGLHRY
jgi:Glutaminase